MDHNLPNLEDRHVLVTGASAGIGTAIAIGLASAGARVVVTDIDGAGAESVARSITERGGRARAYRLDVCDLQSCRNLAAQIAQEAGDIDSIVNNAGVSLGDQLDSVDFFERWRKTFAVNVDGPMHVISAFLEHLRRTRGAIVNIASTTSFVAAQGSVAYTASKGAVLQLTKVLARELAPQGIRVNAVAPGMVATPLTANTRQNPDRMEIHLNRSMMRRVGEPEELVAPVALLLSEGATYMTGTTIAVDGGYLAR